MGTTVTRRVRGEMSDKQFFEQEFNTTFDAGGTKGDAFYAAKDGMCLVIKCGWVGKDDSYYPNGFYYKPMGEQMHPYYYDVPKSVWTKLRPLPEGPEYNNARAWRAIVTQQWVTYPKGTKLRTEVPVHFKHVQTQEFIVWDWQKKHFLATGVDGLVRVTRILDYRVSVVP